MSDIPEEPPLTITRWEVREIIENALATDDIVVEVVGESHPHIAIYTNDYVIEIPIIWDAMYYRAVINIPIISVQTHDYIHNGKIVRESKKVKIIEES